MLEELEKYSENNRLEAKAAKGGLPKSIWETYSAFANTAGGVILLGVEEHDDHSLHAVGVKDPRKLLDDFWNTVNDPQRVSARVLDDSSVSVEDVDGKEVVVINVPRADRRAKPVYLHDNPSHAYRRNNTGDYKCTMGEIRSMMRDADDVSQDSKPLPGVRMDELCQDTVRSYRARYKQYHDEDHPWTKATDNEFLRLIGAAAYDDEGVLRPTGAGLLMFGWDWRVTEVFPEYFLDYRQQLDITERWQDRVISQGGDWSGNVLDFYYRVSNLVKQALKTPFRLEGTTRVDDTPAHKALREALANCLANANYQERRGVVVVWEPDKITIKNPGDFRIPVERALQGGESDPRNKTMLRIFSYVNVGERAGSGVPTIVANWTSCGYETPRWDEEFGPDRTTLTLPLTYAEGGESAGNRTQNAVDSGGRFVSDATDTARNAILALFASEGIVLKSADIAESIGLGKTRTNELLRSLVNDGLIVAEGAARSRVYRKA